MPQVLVRRRDPQAGVVQLAQPARRQLQVTDGLGRFRLDQGVEQGLPADPLLDHRQAVRVLVERLGNAVGPPVESLPVQFLDNVMTPLAGGPRLHVVEALDDDLGGRARLLRADRHLGDPRGRGAAGLRRLLEVRPAAARRDLLHHPRHGVERVIEDRRIDARVAQGVRVRAGGRREAVGMPVLQRPGGLQDRVIRVRRSPRASIAGSCRRSGSGIALSRYGWAQTMAASGYCSRICSSEIRMAGIVALAP